MSSNRTIEDIFSSLQNLAEMREHEEEGNHTIPPNCLCGKDQFALHQNDDESHSQEVHDHDIIYIESTPQGLRYAVCPACNPKLFCDLCQGTGHKTLKKIYLFETEDGDFEHEIDELSPNSCSCTLAERLVERLNRAVIPCKYMSADIHTIQTDHLNESQKRKLLDARDKTMEFCDLVGNSCNLNFENQKYFLTLSGPVGSGKTMIAIAALKYLITTFNLAGRFVDFQFLLSQLKAEYEKRKSGETLLQELRDVDVLIIDEFGKGRNENEWQLEKLDDLVNSRYNAQKITIITTNYLPPELKYDEKEIPKLPSKTINNYWEGKQDTLKSNTPVNESFWNQSLLERIGARMYERIFEVSRFVDFMGIPSYRKFLGKKFLNRF